MMNKLLVGSAALFILSLFTGSPLILTICLTLFIIIVAINCYDLWKNKNIIYILDKIAVYIVLIIIGIMTVILSMINMWVIAMN